MLSPKSVESSKRANSTSIGIAERDAVDTKREMVPIKCFSFYANKNLNMG